MFNQFLALYKVYDVEDGTYWVTPKNKDTWQAAHHAKNAVNANPPKFMWGKDRHGHITKHSKDNLKFGDQSRLVIEKAVYSLDAVDEVI